MGRKIRILQPGLQKLYSYFKKKRERECVCTQGGDVNPTPGTMFVMTGGNACCVIVWSMIHLNLFKCKMPYAKCKAKLV